MEYLLSVDNYKYKSWGEKFKNNEVKIFSLPLNIEWKTKFFNDIAKKVDVTKIDKYFSNLLTKTNGKINIYPYPDLLFNAFNHTNYNDIKVVFIGLDPYKNSINHNGVEIPEAMGLSFSVPIGVPIPSSLCNIYNNAMRYKQFYERPTHGNLEFWAYQGCLMLNTALTLQKGYTGSHANIWKDFTDAIIKKLSDDKEKLVFVIWGAQALTKLDLIDTKKHDVIISSHPSGLSFNNKLGKYPSFTSIDQFGEINKILKKNKKEEIIWQI